ncbi:MAG: hypothetical protein HS111_36075 [Kofleriaceae bacterium]|nr:hypothetical protein [Kofleriaceae bacterium]
MALVIGTPAALRGRGAGPRLVVVPLDVASDGDRRLLTALERDFAFELARSWSIAGACAARACARRSPRTWATCARAAGDHLRAVPAASASFALALAAVMAPWFDLLGLQHLRARRAARRQAGGAGHRQPGPARPGASPAASSSRRARTTWSRRAGSRCRAGTRCAPRC